MTVPRIAKGPPPTGWLLVRPSVFARALGISAERLRVMAAKHQFREWRDGLGQRIYHRADLERLLRERAKAAAAKAAKETR